jgi:hypothetical protein
MSNGGNTSKQAESNASPNVEPDHVEGAPTADNPPATAGPNHSLSNEKSKHRLHAEQLKLELARNEADNIRNLATLEKILVGLKDRVANQRNRISNLKAGRKATETELKAKLWSAQLAAKENIASLLARMSGGKNEPAKAQSNLLDSTKSIAKALKLKDAAKENNDNRKQIINNQLNAKHQLELSLAKSDLKKHKDTLSRELEKKRKQDDIHHHHLAEIAACKASSERVKETAASHKTRVKEKALETSSQQVQTTCLLNTANLPYCSSTMVENRLSRNRS